MNQKSLERLLTKVQAGTLTVATALAQLRTLPYEDLGFASLDHHRSIRQGFPEVIFCEGKTAVQIRAIAKALLKHHRLLLATRATRQVATLIKRLDKRAVYHDEARIVSIRDPTQRLQGHILVITAGTSDIPVAEEARVTAEVMGSKVETLYDVGVAGIHRLLERQSQLMKARVAVVVAGMDGVLPSVRLFWPNFELSATTTTRPAARSMACSVSASRRWALKSPSSAMPAAERIVVVT